MSLPPLSPDQAVKPARFELRMSVVYAAAFVPMGIHLPYFPLWLEESGFDAGQIALILALPMFARLATTPVFTALADRARDRVHVMAVLAAATFLVSLGYFLPPALLPVLVISLALAVTWSPVGPLSDSLALSGVRRWGVDYASLRLWGSAAFLAGNMGGGLILQRWGAEIVPLLLAVCLALTLVSLVVAPRLGRPRRASPLSAASLHGASTSLMRPALVLALVGGGIINASHGLLYGFVSIHWRGEGLSEAVVGFLWTWSVLAEIVMMAFSRRLLSSVTSRRFLLLAAAASCLRWIAFPMIAPLGLGLPGFFAVQTLHAFSAGFIVLGIQKMIAESVSDGQTGAAQGLAFGATGFAMALVMLASGPIYASFGADGFFVMAVLALAGGLLVAYSARLARSAP